VGVVTGIHLLSEAATIAGITMLSSVRDSLGPLSKIQSCLARKM
jgi:hypothetical protein